jgi:cell division protein FtsX
MRARPVHFVVSGVSVLAGVVLTVAVLLVAGWRPVPVKRFEVRVFLTGEATPEQTDAARAVLGRIAGDAGVTRRTGEQGYADLEKSYAEAGDTLPGSVTPETIPDALVISAEGREVDCEPFAALNDNPGVSVVRVAEFADGVAVSATEC